MPVDHDRLFKELLTTFFRSLQEKLSVELQPEEVQRVSACGW
ncbi:hypothetical protein MTBGP_13830 [Moorella thermoacetica]